MPRSNWQFTNLGAVANVEMGQSPPSEFVSESAGAGVPFLQGNAEFTALHPVPRLWCRRPAKMCRVGDSLISVRAPVGAQNRADREYCIGRGLAAIRFLGVNPDFGHHALGFYSLGLRRVAQGTTFEAVGGADLRALAIPQCAPAEQSRIAEILDTVDEAIRETEQVIAKLEQTRQGLVHDLLTLGIDDDGELRDPERHPEQFKDSHLGRIPKGWNVSRCEDLTDPEAPICYGIVQPGPSVAGGVPVVTIGDLEGDYGRELHRAALSVERRYARSRVVPGDLLLSIKGTIGRVGVVPHGFEGNISRDLARIRLRATMVPSYVQHYFLSPIGQRRLDAAVVGTTRAEVSIHVLKGLLVPEPSRPEQSWLAQNLDCHGERLVAEESLLSKLKSLKRGLMDDLLTGRVRVKVPLGASP